MTKTSLKKFWIIFTGACSLSAGIALACAGDWGPEYGTSNFTPYVDVRDRSYSPFFVSNLFYFGIGHDDGHDARFNEANTKEWSAYLGQAISTSSLDYLLQKAEKRSIDSALTASGGNARLTTFLRYLQLAKQAETYSLNHVSGWYDYQEQKKEKPSFDNAAFRKACITNMAKAEPFVRQRYLFQLQRNYFFYGSPQESIDFYLQHEKELTPGTMYYRTMAYAAGSYYRQKNYTKANYLYSLVFAGSAEMRTVAHYSFHPQEEADWKATMALCRNKEEQATLWQMLGIFYADETRSIGEIYRLDPKSDKMDLLLSRGVNLYEQKFFRSDLGDFFPVRSDSASQAFLALITRIASEGKAERPWIWQMAVGYLHALGGNYAASESWYNKVTLPKAGLAAGQLRLLRLLNKIGMVTKLDGRTEDQLLPDLEWLASMSASSEQDGLRASDAFDWTKRRFAEKYIQQHDLIKAQCFVSNVRFYGNDKQAADMKAFLGKPSKTGYEAFCSKLSPIKADDIGESQAIRASYAGSLEEAIEKISHTPGGAVVLPGNPFNARIQDCHDCDHAAPQKIKYTKLSFLQKLKEIKDKAASGADVYTNSILLGNAYYNMSDYGNARVFYQCSIIGSGYGIDSVFQPMLFSNVSSIKYYSDALKAATTNEQKAKCQYLLAKCQRNEWYNTVPEERRNGVDFKAWDGFAALKQYQSTQYYREVLRECGYFRTYTNQR